MKIDFIKYQGAGNDFIMVDCFTLTINLEELTSELVAGLCHRQFGIGADGLILLKPHERYDFEMIYYNSDGRPSSMCGNGGRCIIKMAHSLGYIKEKCTFLAVDGIHEGIVSDQIELKMASVSDPEQKEEKAYFINTGSPHYVKFVDSVKELDLLRDARAIRYSDAYRAEGTNVNFVEILSDNKLAIRTYERGVEAETLACGTGIVAASLIYNHLYSAAYSVQVQALGGLCRVEFTREKEGWDNIWLVGPAEAVFSGSVETNFLVTAPD